MPHRILIALCLFQFAGFAFAEEPPAAEPAPQITREQFEAGLKYRQGEVALPNGVATLKVPAGFRYLDPADSRKILEQAWGNPSGGDTQGMLFPSDVSPLAEDGWGVIITYEEDGHVSDDDADSINYDDLLKEMQEGVVEANKERTQQGYETIELIGWASKPFYDKAAKKLHWAKELKFADNPEHTLNYNIRILGRKGVLVLNAVAGMKQIGPIKDRMQEVLAFTDFKPGFAYADFDESVDKTAAYGLAALVAGGVAAKAGLFAKLLAMAVAFKKFIIIGAVALFAGIGKLFRRKPAA